MNRSIIVGRLTRDPELKYTGTGKAVGNFTVAVNRPFTNQQGERDADFINCVAWGKQAENLANYMKKGSQIGVDGRLQSRTYENQQGQTVFITEVVADSVQFLETKKDNQPQNAVDTYNQQWQGSQQTKDPFKNNIEPIDIQDEDLPF